MCRRGLEHFQSEKIRTTPKAKSCDGHPSISNEEADSSSVRTRKARKPYDLRGSGAGSQQKDRLGTWLFESCTKNRNPGTENGRLKNRTVLMVRTPEGSKKPQLSGPLLGGMSGDLTFRYVDCRMAGLCVSSARSSQSEVHFHKAFWNNSVRGRVQSGLHERIVSGDGYPAS